MPRAGRFERPRRSTTSYCAATSAGSKQSISPRDEEGDLTGAQRLLTGSIEYQYNVTGKWWGAVFYDVGEAVEDFTTTNFKSGAGFGIRWESPIGPVKLDIARPVGDPDENSLAFYIGLGSEL